MKFRAFREVIELDDGSLRSLLTSGEAPERVWAAWALGLRRFGELPAITRHEPSPGVRRHLVIVLLGLGERDAVAAMLANDPDPYVRASACLHLARVVARDDDSLVDLLVSRAGLDSSALVRVALAQGASADSPKRIEDALATMLEDGDREVRLATVDALARGGTRNLDRLQRRLSCEQDDEVTRAILVHRLAQVGVERLFEGLFGDERVVALALDIANGRTIPAEVVRGLLPRHSSLLMRRLSGSPRIDRYSLGSLIDLCVPDGRFVGEWVLASALSRTDRDALSPYDHERVSWLRTDIERRAIETFGHVPSDARIAELHDGYFDEDEACPWVDGLSLLHDLRRLTLPVE